MEARCDCVIAEPRTDRKEVLGYLKAKYPHRDITGPVQWQRLEQFALLKAGEQRRE